MTSPTPTSRTKVIAPGALTSQEVATLHSNSDVDSSVTAQHHTLGIQHNQASPGDHKHDGKASKRIGTGINPAFPSVASATYNQAQIQSIIDALRSIGFGT